MTDSQVRRKGSTAIQAPESGVAFVEGVHYRVLDTGCWEWLGSRDPKGYGLTIGKHRDLLDARAHRAALKLTGVDVPKGDHVHHACEYEPCINPDHLEHHTHSGHLRLHKQADSALSWDDVRAIRAQAHEGVSVQVLAERWGLSLGTIHPLIAGRTWHDPEYERPTWTRECLECGVEFMTHRPRQTFCRAGHRTVYNARLARRAAA